MTENDTQWPRYQVFLQEKTGATHQDVGSVHAPDSELALQNARDVFVRRPECINIWVVPADEIFSKTAQELASKGLVADAVAPKSGEAEMFTYCVFAKKRSAGAQTFIGEVEAASPEQAMQRALEKFVDEKPPFAWWVFPKRCIVQSKQETIDSMFAPARHKSFRMSTDFHTLTEMRKALAQAKEGKKKSDGS